MIEMKNVSKWYGSFQVLNDCSTSIAKGEVVVTVKSKVGFYNRNPLRVQEELETLARNEAPSAGANAVQAAAAPADGSQRFAAFQCPPR